ncbi:MAG: hypothetical protein VX112_03480 [Pseudomonadota bacterium]|nr:hypothetical protein [Pseudomonadota bacterium]
MFPRESIYASAVPLLCAIGLVFSLCAKAYLSPEMISGYWELYNRKGQLHSIIYIDAKDNVLQAYGIRSFPTKEGEIPYLCYQCSGSLHNKPLWSGKYMPLSGFKRQKGKNTWRKGRAVDPKRGVVLHPNISFLSPVYARIDISFFIFTASVKMKKITEEKAFAGCEYIRGKSEMSAWGDLDKLENRNQMLAELKLKPDDLMKGINEGAYCYSPFK